MRGLCKFCAVCSQCALNTIIPESAGERRSGMKLFTAKFQLASSGSNGFVLTGGLSLCRMRVFSERNVYCFQTKRVAHTLAATHLHKALQILQQIS